jgi:hypothetical protein
MRAEQASRPDAANTTRQPFSAAVTPNPAGEGWLTIVDLGSGITMTKWCEAEEDARHYGAEIARWLTRGHRW